MPDNLKARLGSVLAEVALNRYPVPSYRSLKAKIRQHMGIPEGYDVVLGNGSDELISIIALACARKDKPAKILAPVPSFVMYALSAQIAGMEFVGVPLKADLTLDLDAMLAAIKKERPAVVYLANRTIRQAPCLRMTKSSASSGQWKISVLSSATKPISHSPKPVS